MRLLLALFWILTAGAVAAQPMERFQIMDSQGFEALMVAYEIDVPQGWTARGEIAWIKPCSGSDMFEFILHVQSPDGRSGFRIQPGHKIVWNDFTGTGLDPMMGQMMRAQMEADRNRLRSQFQGSNCHVALVRDPAEMFRALVAAHRPAGMQVTQSAPQEALNKQYAALFSQARGFQVFHDARLIEMRYDLGGGPVTETVLWSWYTFQMPPQDPQFGMFSQVTTVDALKTIRIAEERRATDDPMLKAIVTSLKPDPKWTARVAEARADRARAAQRAAEQRREDNELAWQRREITRIVDNFIDDLNHYEFPETIWQ